MYTNILIEQIFYRDFHQNIITISVPVKNTFIPQELSIINRTNMFNPFLTEYQNYFIK